MRFEISKEGTKVRSPDGLSLLNQNKIFNKHYAILCHKILKTYNKIQLTKSELDLNNLKITNHPPSPEVNTPYTQLNPAGE